MEQEQQEEPILMKVFMHFCFSLQLTPSAFLKEISLTTEQRLASTHEVHLPRIIQLLDMSETSHQKVSIFSTLVLLWGFLQYTGMKRYGTGFY